MQNYNQQTHGYQRPGSTTGFTGQAGPPPPPYTATQGYQSAAPTTSSQWAPPPPLPSQNNATSQQWNQPQHSHQGSWGQAQQQQPTQGSGGYNPSTYGAMPGAYGQAQQQDQPPLPPPKPHGFAAAVQQQQTQQTPQNWKQQSYGGQQTQQNYQSAQQGQQGQQGGYPQQQGGFQSQGNQQQQSYNNAAPPPPSGTPGGSYFPSSQNRPGSIYAADQAGTGPYSSPVQQQPPNTVLSPNEQQPAHIPPSLSGQGVQSYMPANTNPMPGVYVPPPPDIPAWQQASHAPLQGTNKKFRYTKPTVDPSFQAQGYQPNQQHQHGHQQQQQQPPQPQPQLQQFGQPAQNQFQQQQQHQGQMQAGQFVQPSQPLQQQFNHQPGSQQYQQPGAGDYNQPPVQSQQTQQPSQQYQQQGSQWQPTPPTDQGHAQQQQYTQAQHYGHQAQSSIVGQQYQQGQDQGIQAPKPINGRTGTSSPNFVHSVSPQSQPVSPVQHRQSMSFSSTYNPSNLGRTSSISSVALGSIRNQQTPKQTGSPAPPHAPTQPPAKVPTPPPPRDSASAFSALGAGGPSDWEHFGNIDEEIDDEDMFGSKQGERKNEPAQLDGVELPAQPVASEVSDEWPSPQVQPAPLNVGGSRRDTFQPTPPPMTSTPTQRPLSQPPQQMIHPQQNFVMGDAAATPPVTQSPQPGNIHQPPPAQQGFVMNDGGWQPPKQNMPTQQQKHQPPPTVGGHAIIMNDGGRTPPKQSTPAQQQYHQPPPSTGNAIIMDNGGWEAQAVHRQSTPRQQQPQQQPPQANTGYVMNNGGWAAPQYPQSQSSAPIGVDAQAANEAHIAELKAKDDAYERLRTDMEREASDLRTEIDRLRTDIENARGHAAGEKNVLNEQIASMKVAAEQAMMNADALSKEKDSVIERLKEDMEGKDDTVRERDATITDLKQQLDAEKQREIPRPTPADLVPDLDPWYAGSLERYIAMLRSEASEPQVEDKINVFTAFLKAESGIRGLDYYNTPPPAPSAQEPVVSPPISQEPAPLSRGASTASTKKRDMHIDVPRQDSTDFEEGGFSPGGRPLLRQKAHLHSTESVPNQPSFASSSIPEQAPPALSNQSTTILTPTSSTDDDFNKTPIQSPPEDEPMPQYKAYVPPASTQAATESTHRQSISSFAPPAIPPLQPKTLGKHDEIFFGEPAQTPAKQTSRPTTSASSTSDVPVPAPLSFAPQPPNASPSPRKDPVQNLPDLLPKQISPPQPNPRLEEIRKAALAFPTDYPHIAESTTKWEKAAALLRKKNDVARQKRQEDSEEHTDQLFNDHEISYADIGAIEDEFKAKERDLKAQEDRDEYKSYVEAVFDPVYDELQADIKSLMDLYIEAESMLHSSTSGIQAIEGGDAPTTKDTLELLQELYGLIEARHEKVVSAVADRDKRYKKTEVTPLYAAGNIAKMKNVEKHFENAEKQALLRAKSEKAERVGELVRIAEEVVVGAVGREQGEADKILTGIKNLSDEAEDGRTQLLNRARDTLLAIKASSKALLTVFNNLEVSLNTSVLEAEMAQAKAENLDVSRLKELEREMSEGEKKLKEEFERKFAVLDQDQKEVEELIKKKGGKVVLSEEEEKARRLAAALEAAKKRNGEL